MKYPYDPLIKDIPGFPEYQISEDGDIYNKKTGNELKQFPNDRNYNRVCLVNNKIKISKSVHRLVALAFIENPDPEKYNQIDHVDRDRQNNKVENLRWVTKYENAQNQSIKLTNISGHKGVSVHNVRGKYKYWRAFIGAYGKKEIEKSFPYTDDGLQQAIAWRAQKEKELFYTQLPPDLPAGL